MQGVPISLRGRGPLDSTSCSLFDWYLVFSCYLFSSWPSKKKFPTYLAFLLFLKKDIGLFWKLLSFFLKTWFDTTRPGPASGQQQNFTISPLGKAANQSLKMRWPIHCWGSCCNLAHISQLQQQLAAKMSDRTKNSLYHLKTFKLSNVCMISW